MEWKKKVVNWRKICEKKVLGYDLEGDEVFIVISFNHF